VNKNKIRKIANRGIINVFCFRAIYISESCFRAIYISESRKLLIKIK